MIILENIIWYLNIENGDLYNFYKIIDLLMKILQEQFLNKSLKV